MYYPIQLYQSDRTRLPVPEFHSLISIKIIQFDKSVNQSVNHTARHRNHSDYTDSGIQYDFAEVNILTSLRFLKNDI